MEDPSEWAAFGLGLAFVVGLDVVDDLFGGPTARDQLVEDELLGLNVADGDINEVFLKSPSRVRRRVVQAVLKAGGEGGHRS